MDDKIMMVPVVGAEDMPDEVEEYCEQKNISTHCATELYWVEDDGNPLAEWLKSLGYGFPAARDDLPGGAWVGVIGT